jgi:hypothetical protein
MVAGTEGAGQSCAYYGFSKLGAYRTSGALPQTFLMAANSSDAFTGFVTNPFIPALRHFAGNVGSRLPLLLTIRM